MPRGKKKTTTTPKGRKRQAEDNEENEDQESTSKTVETTQESKKSQDNGVNDNSHGAKASHQKKEPKQQHKAKKGKVQSLTVQEIISDELTSLSLQYWAGDEIKSFEPKIIEDIYAKELKLNDLQRIMLLEVSQYLENYLWKNFEPTKASFAHIMSIIIMVNEKFRGNIPAWDCFHERAEVFPQFFERVLSLQTERVQFTLRDKSIVLLFLINCYQSLEDEMVRKECMRLVSLSVWNSLSPNRLAKELKAMPKLSKLWNTMKQKESKSKKDQVDLEKTFFPDLIRDFFAVLDNVNRTGTASPDQVLYCERFAELILDLLCQLPTRRFFLAVVEDFHVVIRCRLSKLSELPEGILFMQLVQMMRFYEGFEVNNFTGAALSDDEITDLHCKKILNFQKIAFKNFQSKLKSIALSNIHEVENTATLSKHLGTLSIKELRELAVELALIRPLDKKDEPTESREYLMEVINSHFERRISQLQAINDMAIYPTEGLLWNDNVIPSDEYNGERPLALPKLNLQFLTFYDYLLRNYDLFRLESTYEIRGDVEDAVRRCNPRKDSSIKNRVVWNGWSRMALPIKEFSLLQVSKPNLGDNKPAQVLAEVQYSLHSFRGRIKDEWDGIKLHDVIFLVTVNPPLYTDEDASKVEGSSFRDAYGVKYVRAGEVVEIVDEEGTPIKDWEVEQSPRVGNIRKIKLLMDTSQYQQDIDQLDEDVYGTFNLIIRRKPKENNFKAVLETIRDLMNTKTVVPEWLHDIFLGYGDPTSYRLGSSAYTNAVTLNFNDTFLNAEHARKSFQGKLKFVSSKFGKEAARAATVEGSKDKDAMEDDKLNNFKPPFKITFPGKDHSGTETVVEAFRPQLPGPYPKDQPKHNQIPFTPVQVEAIQSGMSEGLTLVVGPPGTGKTDVAVQIISNWYHNFPNQRILIVTHSNQALNQLFEKIMALDIQQRHLLRLGHGQEHLDTEHDFSKWGRVNYMLNRRLELLAEVDRLAKSLGAVDDVASTCETAEYFYESQVKSLINNFKKQYPQHYGLQTAVPGASEADLVKLFPFREFFKSAPQPLFKQETFDEDIRVADGCFNYISSIITELVECRAFELLRSAYDRGNYLVTKQARIVAMTCTHAALKRAELVQLGFKYDNLLMEEAAQILEIETFIPMLLQEQLNQNESRLKRVVLIGDHHQLPPIIKNIAFQKYSHMDQSLFARFVRLGVPTIELDAQGRARSSIAQLYNWRYKKLVDLPSVLQNAEFQLANAGFVHEYQLIDVGDFDGKGEYQPTPYFYQNLGEAEYVVAVYMYMRLLGYPANKISILTTYNGQKHLIRDVLNARTAWNAPFFGRPKVTTVDRYQGQQNDFILLSLVRTKAVGHLRDIRRLVVAMSRARLGLYVFCRRALFENCYELSQTFSQLCQRPDKLELIEAESYPTTRKLEGTPKNIFQVQDVVHMGQLLVSLQQSMQAKLEEFRKEYEAKQQEEVLKQQQLFEQQQQQYDDLQPQSKKPGRKQKSKNPDEEEEEEESEEEI